MASCLCHCRRTALSPYHLRHSYGTELYKTTGDAKITSEIKITSEMLMHAPGSRMVNRYTVGCEATIRVRP
jgi:hypothetical protein